MKKSGIVTQIKNRYVCLLAPSGEFVKVKYKGTCPSIGEIYTGELYTAPRLKMPLIAASMAFILFSGGLYSYYMPAYAVTVEINPSVKLHVNMWDRIVKAEPINEDGEKLLNSVKVTNMNIDGGLEAIVTEAKEDKFIDEASTSSDNIVKITIEGRTVSDSSLQHFKEALKEEKINLQIIANDKTSQSTEVQQQPKKDQNINNSKSSSDNSSKNKSKVEKDKIKDTDRLNENQDKDKNKDNNNKDDKIKDTKENKVNTGNEKKNEDEKKKEDNANISNNKKSSNKNYKSNSKIVNTKNKSNKE
ncbi:anti-sigma-I factor RsgI family protein [Clostridium thermarum]|uniref:anti-sigma-I factor RsgI family protein n=1 Tax=Clostridium thermarum TaxID=1716543 RepID=UPI0013D71911|nr:anti-sigma factor domain-containing protein [Clostridium thermarum]